MVNKSLVYFKLFSTDHYSEFVLIGSHMRKNLTAPTLYVHAIPATFGREVLENTEIYKRKISQNAEYTESLFVEGSHHLHMVKSKEAAQIVLNFLDKINNTNTNRIAINPVKSKL